MNVKGTEGGVLRVVGVKLTNVYVYDGGGMYIYGGTVELAMCAIDNTRLV